MEREGFIRGVTFYEDQELDIITLSLHLSQTDTRP